MHVDPLRDLPNRRGWRAALEQTDTVIAHAAALSEGLWEFADIVFPAESYAEKEGTVTHPDGRVQRLRPAIKRPDAVRAEWQVVADLAARLGHDLKILHGPMATAKLFEAVPFYAGLTLDELGGRGVRWTERPAAAGWPVADTGPFGLEVPPHAPDPGTAPSPWRRDGGHPAPGHVPLDLGRARGRAVARAEVPAPRPARRAQSG